MKPKTLEEIKKFCKLVWLTEIDNKEAQEIFENQQAFFASYYKQKDRFNDRWIKNPEHIKYGSKI